jgi:hypothetical protein
LKIYGLRGIDITIVTHLANLTGILAYSLVFQMGNTHHPVKGQKTPEKKYRQKGQEA